MVKDCNMKKINILVNHCNPGMDLSWSNNIGTLKLNGLNYINRNDINKNSLFIIPITPGGLNGYLGIHSEYKKSFLDFIDSELKDYIINHRGYILISYMQEGHVTQDDYKNLHNILLKHKIPPDKVLFVSSNINGKSQYDTFCKKMPTLTSKRIKIFESNHMLESSNQIYNSILNGNYNKDLDDILPYKQSFVQKDDFYKLKDFKREKYFLTYNRIIREYRLALISMIYEYGLDSKGIISLGADKVDRDFGGVWPDKINDFLKDDEIVNIALNKIKKLYPINADGDISANWVHDKNGEVWNGVVGQWSNFSEQYKRIYFNIVTESSYYEDCIYMSEKIFKPISNLVPFIIVSNPFFLSKMREIGFKTFHPFINESYDEEVDNDKRFYMIVDEIKRLCSMKKNEIHNWYYSMEDILFYNQDHFSNYKKSDHKRIWNEISEVVDG